MAAGRDLRLLPQQQFPRRRSDSRESALIVFSLRSDVLEAEVVSLE
jgi:hypothetical protein